jgi:hypothetical protein
MEGQAHLAQKIGDVLNALHELKENGKAVGARILTKNVEQIASQIRVIIRGNWSESDHKYLKELQKVGVALLRGIDEKEDLMEIVNAAATILEDIVSKLGVPSNRIGTPENVEQPKDSSPDPANLSPPQQ